jgi:hypothetical protein
MTEPMNAKRHHHSHAPAAGGAERSRRATAAQLHADAKRTRRRSPKCPPGIRSRATVVRKRVRPPEEEKYRTSPRHQHLGAQTCASSVGDEGLQDEVKPNAA